MTDDTAIKLGVIGTSRIAQRLHGPGIAAEADDLNIVAACDINPDDLAKFSDQFGVEERYSDYRELLDRTEIDAVLIVLPHYMHEEACGEALRRGKHVLIEKPIARTCDEADRMIAEAQKAGRVLMVGFNERYEPRYQKVSRLIEAGAIGRIHCARIDHHQDFRKPVGSWWRSKEAVGGGCVIGSGIHRLDLLRYYLGEPEEVFAFHTSDPTRLEAEVAVTASIRFQSGAIGEFLCNWAVPHGPKPAVRRYLGEGMTLFGDKGTIIVNREESILIKNEPSPGADPIEPIDANSEPFESMWAHFARCIRSGAKPLTNSQSAKRSLAFCLAIYQSMETAKPVKIP